MSTLFAVLFTDFPNNAFSAENEQMSQYAKFGNELLAAGEFERAIKYYRRALNYGGGECVREKYDLLVRLKNRAQSARDLKIGSPGGSLYCKPLKHLGFTVTNLPFDLRQIDLSHYHVLIIDLLEGTTGGVKDFVRSGGIAVFAGNTLGNSGNVDYDLFGVEVIFREGGSRHPCCCPHKAVILDRKHPAFSHFCTNTISECGSSFAIPVGKSWNIVVREKGYDERPVFFESDYGKGKYIFCLHGFTSAYDTRQKHRVDELWTLLGEHAYILECIE
jgi:hypothetical protein